MPPNPNDNILPALAINPGTFELNVPSANDLRDLGVIWVRYLINGLHQNFQTGQNTELDRLLDQYRGMGVKILALFNPESMGGILPPPHGDIGWGDATSGYIGRAADIVAKIATYYRGKIDALEVFNEPDVMELVPEDYALILKACYPRIKAVSDVPVVSAGICCGQAFDYLTRVLQAAPNSCDEVGWHLYGQRLDNFPSPNWGVGDLRDSLTRASALAGAPLWVTEIGADLKYSWPQQPSPEQGVAEYLKRAYAIMRDLGPNVVAHAFWFTWKHPDGNYGMVDNTAARRPAWYAFQAEAQSAPPPAVQILDATFSPASLQPNQTLNVAITVRNNSAATVPTQSPDPGFVYSEGDTFYSKNFPDVKGAFRIAVDFDGRTGIDHPYRWGLGAALAPGEMRIVTGAIRLSAAQSRNYWSGLVQEQIAWTDDGTGKTLIAVTPGASVPPRVDNVQFTLTTVNQQTLLNVTMTVTNPSTAALTTQGPDPGFMYDEGDTFYSRGFAEIRGSYRAGVDFDGRTGIDHPYRWGLGSPLGPSESRTITGAIRLKTAGTRNYWVGLVQEQTRWIADRQGVQPITISDPFTDTPQISAVTFTPTTPASNQLLAVNVTVRNNSSAPLATQLPDPGFVYAEGDTFYSRGFAEARGAYRAGVDFDGRTGIDHPYRWGFGTPLAPGESRTITGYIHLKNVQARNYWAGLVQEQLAWLDDKSGAQLVTVTPAGEPHISAVNFSLDANRALQVSITIKNDSIAAIPTQAPDPGFVYSEGDTFYSKNFPDVAGAYRVGVDFDGRTGIDHPHRWGFGTPLAPGETRTITGTIQLTSAPSAPRNFWAGLVQERVAWMYDRVGVIAIK